MSEASNPLVDPPPAEVPLPEAPLVRVIAQVRFPQVASIVKQEFIAGFQESIRPAYTVMRSADSQRTVVGPDQTVTQLSKTWRFSRPESPWQVTLAPDFVALETTRYSSRDDFMKRLEEVLRALEEHIDPQHVDRVGIRYIDRVALESPHEAIPALLNREMAGALSTPMARSARYAICESQFALEKESAELKARWGLVPPGGTVDPAIEPLDDASWILDLDAFQAESARPFNVDDVVRQARAFAERIYTFFRWAVTEDFLKRYGGRAMNLQPRTPEPPWVPDSSTTSGHTGESQAAQRIVIPSGNLYEPGTSSLCSGAEPVWIAYLARLQALDHADRTVAGGAEKESAVEGSTPVDERPEGGTPQEAICELRRLSGLTWDEIGRLFDVSRRSAHAWASGKAPSAENERRIRHALDVVRTGDRGDPQRTRDALLAVHEGTSVFDLLRAARWNDSRIRFGSTKSRPEAPRHELSAEAKHARRPAPPEELVGALNDRVHTEVGKGKPARTARNTRRGRGR